MEELIQAHTDLGAADIAMLDGLVAQWDILADLAFSDLILWVPDRDVNVFWAVAQIRPATGPTSLIEDVVGDEITYDPERLVTEAYLSHEISSTVGDKRYFGIPVDGLAVPILANDSCVAVVELHTNRMGTRALGALEETYSEVAQILCQMLRVQKFPDKAGGKTQPWLSPRVGDGTIRVNSDGIVTFASPNTVSSFRRLGLLGNLEGEDLVKVVKKLIPANSVAVEKPLQKAVQGKGSCEVELESPHAYVRMRVQTLHTAQGSAGIIIACRDTTELRSKERELITKDATIREINHRIKNNLQTVASLLRLQSRRIEIAEAKAALEEAMKRVSSIAVVHEILSQDFDATLYFDDVADRLLKLVGSVASTRGKVKMTRQGTFGQIPQEIATDLSLVLTELCQNAVQHGLKQGSGEVVVHPVQSKGRLSISIMNAGEPLPKDFSVEKSSGLGLSIVRTLLQQLHGTLTMQVGDGGVGTVATVLIPLRGYSLSWEYS